MIGGDIADAIVDVVNETFADYGVSSKVISRDDTTVIYIKKTGRDAYAIIEFWIGSMTSSYNLLCMVTVNNKTRLKISDKCSSDGELISTVLSIVEDRIKYK